MLLIIIELLKRYMVSLITLQKNQYCYMFYDILRFNLFKSMRQILCVQ